MKWYVWTRWVHKNGIRSFWCEVPKEYRTKRAAHMAVRNFNSPEWNKPTALIFSGAMPECVAFPEGMIPRNDMILNWV